MSDRSKLVDLRENWCGDRDGDARSGFDPSSGWNLNMLETHIHISQGPGRVFESDF